MNVGVPQEAIVNLDEALARNPPASKGHPRTAWKAFFSRVSDLLTAMSMSGTTAQRPTTFLYVGRPYFDTTLGIEIWLSSVGPTVWVRWDGAPV